MAFLDSLKLEDSALIFFQWLSQLGPVLEDAGDPRPLLNEKLHELNTELKESGVSIQVQWSEWGDINSQSQFRSDEQLSIRLDVFDKNIGIVKIFCSDCAIVLWKPIFKTFCCYLQTFFESFNTKEKLDKQSLELEHASKMVALGTLVSGVAHEINNPNHVIMLNSPLIINLIEDLLGREGLDDDGEDKLRKLLILLEDINQSAKRIERIVGELKNFARKGPLEKASIESPNHIVKSAISLLKNQIQKATDNFNFIPGDFLPPLWGNFQRIEQIVINLILNACQALSCREQKIEVRTTFDTAARQFILTVEDQGVGIDDVSLTQVKDPFFTTKRDRGGTGLGLSVSSKIAEEHGGVLEFQSKVGEGTKVTLQLPTIES